jgi:hypothetical protein
VAEPEGSRPFVCRRFPFLEREGVGADDLGGQSERRRFSLVAIEGKRRYRYGCRDGNEDKREERSLAKPRAGLGTRTGATIDPSIVETPLVAPYARALEGSAPAGGAKLPTKRTTGTQGDGAFMEPSRRNQRQNARPRNALKQAKTVAVGLRLVAAGVKW